MVESGMLQGRTEQPSRSSAGKRQKVDEPAPHVRVDVCIAQHFTGATVGAQRSPAWEAGNGRLASALLSLLPSCACCS